MLEGHFSPINHASHIDGAVTTIIATVLLTTGRKLNSIHVLIAINAYYASTLFYGTKTWVCRSAVCQQLD